MEAKNNPEPNKLHACHRREHGEPVDNIRPVSMVVMLVICLLFFWVGVYIALYHGNFDPYTFDETAKAGVVEPPPPPEPLPILGAKIFKRNCVQCHQADGMGVAGSYPPLVGSSWVLGSPERFAKVILSGMSGPLEVKGQTYNGNMPAWAGTLNDRQIAAVMTYLRGNADWGHNIPEEISPEFIASLRAQVGNRKPWLPEELLKLYP